MSTTNAAQANTERTNTKRTLGAMAAEPTGDRASVVDIAILLIRIALGGVLLAHGVQKFAMMGVDQVGQYFASLGLPAPELAAGVVATLEVVGGLAIILGVLVRPLSVIIAIELVVASVTAHGSAGFFVSDGGWELTGLLALSLVALALLGAGRLSVVAPLGARIPVFLR